MSISLDHPAPIKCVLLPPFIFLPTRGDHTFWRYFWPFLSGKQFIVVLALTALAVIVCSVVLAELVELRVRRVIFICFVFGVVGILLEQLPAKITIASTRGQVRQLIPILERILIKNGYARTALHANGNRICFRPHSDAQRCLYSPKQDVELCLADENIIEVRGSRFDLISIEIDLRSEVRA